jgi:outer membrane protein
MTMTRTALALALLPVLPGLAAAQEAPATLSLAEAVELAREHNPEYRARLNDEAVADWGVREAYASFLPTATASGGLSSQGGGEARIGGFTSDDIGLGETPSYYFSSYSLSVSLGLDGSSFYRVGRERAARRATLATLDAAAATLEAQVTRQYLAALRMRDAVELARAELERAEANLALAEARYAVEAATAIEAKQAEVERGRAEVELLRGQVNYDTERLRLLQLIGVELDREVELTTTVEVFEPTWELASLLEAALASQPELAAARATAASAQAGVGMARSAYWPRLSISTGLSGYTRKVGSDQYLLDQAEASVLGARQQCQLTNDILSRLTPPLEAQDCSQFQFTDEMRAAILDSNSQFPFNFETEPVSVSLGVSVPIFQGLSRQRQLEAAHAQAEDARLRMRAQELQVRADVEASYRLLNAAHQAVRLEERNRQLAEDQLRLARERYRVGAASFLELMEAEALKAGADRAYLLGVYSFQEALTALEAAVGQDLTTPEG